MISQFNAAGALKIFLFFVILIIFYSLYLIKSRSIFVKKKELIKQKDELFEINAKMRREMQLREDAEKKLRESEERYRNFIMQSAEGIYRMDFDEPIDISLPIEKQLDLMLDTASIAECNLIMARMYGYSDYSEMIGKRPRDLYGADVPKTTADANKAFIRNNYRIIDQETEEIGIDGQKRYFLNNSMGIIKNNHLVSTWGTQREIANLKIIEQQLKSSLKEKEVLLKEVHHRVKNNLAVISSLLSLQARQIDKPETRAMFNESQSRIRSMALVHQKLYQSEDLAYVDFDDYISSTVQNLLDLYSAKKLSIDIDVQAHKIELPIDIAVPCGLIINELLSNAFKYAFPEKANKKGRISIIMKKNTNNLVALRFSDNGAGIPEHINLEETESLGLKLVYILAKDQLSGKCDIIRNKGTTFDIVFPINNVKG